MPRKEAAVQCRYCPRTDQSHPHRFSRKIGVCNRCAQYLSRVMKRRSVKWIVGRQATLERWQGLLTVVQGKKGRKRRRGLRAVR